MVNKNCGFRSKAPNWIFIKNRINDGPLQTVCLLLPAWPAEVDCKREGKERKKRSMRQNRRANSTVLMHATQGDLFVDKSGK